jgi:hypothetical protein
VQGCRTRRNVGESPKGEVRRILLLGTWVNKGIRKGRDLEQPRPIQGERYVLLLLLSLATYREAPHHRLVEWVARQVGHTGREEGHLVHAARQILTRGERGAGTTRRVEV